MKLKLYIDDIPDSNYLPLFEDIGVEQYSILYQFDVNDQSSTNGTVNVQQILDKVETPGYVDGGAEFAKAKTVFLDFEEPHTFILMTGNEKEKFHRTISENMVNAINTLKKKYPEKRWGYYAIPNVPIWICDDGGDVLRHETCTKQIRVFEANVNQIKKFKDSLVESYKDVADSCDMISAELYQHDILDNDRANLDKIDPLKAKMSGEICQRLNPTGEKENLAWISPVIFKEMMADVNGVNSKVRGFETIPFDELLKDTLYPFLANGGDGFIIWFAGNWRVQMVTSPLEDLNQERRYEQITLRDHFNKQFLGSYGGSPYDDSYWTNPGMKSIIKTIYTDFLYKFCKSILQKE
jgi:hypothetical protein